MYRLCPSHQREQREQTSHETAITETEPEGRLRTDALRAGLITCTNALLPLSSVV